MQVPCIAQHCVQLTRGRAPSPALPLPHPPVLYDAGVDVHADDTLGRLAVSDEGLRRRELLVLDSCLGLGVPVAGYVGGGYDGDLAVLAARHCWLHRAAASMWRDHRL